MRFVEISFDFVITNKICRNRQLSPSCITRVRRRKIQYPDFSSGQEETKLRNRCQKLKDDYSDLKTRNEYLEASNTEHKDRIQGLEINVQREKSSRSKAEQENVQLLVRLQKLEAEITLINSYLKSKTLMFNNSIPT